MAPTFKVKILRQANPATGSHWETFDLPLEDGMNLTTVFQRIAANPVTADNQKTTPPAYDACCLEEVCGACSMVINGRVRQACSALIAELLEESGGTIEVSPMTKFPVVRDLVVNRSSMFKSLEKVKAWIRVDGYHDIGQGSDHLVRLPTSGLVPGPAILRLGPFDGSAPTASWPIEISATPAAPVLLDARVSFTDPTTTLTSVVSIKERSRTKMSSWKKLSFGVRKARLVNAIRLPSAEIVG